MAVVLRSLLFLVFGAAVLFLMTRFDLIDFKLILNSISIHPGFIFIAFLSQMVTLLAVSFRYSFILKALGVKVKIKDSSAATLVSTAVGQWAPGAMAIIELIRISLMFGAKHDTKTLEGIRGKIFIASLYDRLLGFFIILFLGFATTVSILIYQFLEVGTIQHVKGLLLLMFFAFSGSGIILILPFISRTKLAQNFLIHSEKKIDTLLAKHDRLKHRIKKIFHTLEHTRKLIALGAEILPSLFLPAILSIIVVAAASFTLYESAKAIDYSLPFFTVVAALPLMSVAALLPLGIGGIGGYQLITMAIFAMFSMDAKLVSSANLLQNTITLFTSTVMGLTVCGIGFAQIKTMINRYVHKKVEN